MIELAKALPASPPGFYANVAKDLRVPYEGEVMTQVLKDARLKRMRFTPTPPAIASSRSVLRRG